MVKLFPKRNLAFAVTGSALFSIAQGAVAQTMPSNLPAAVVCYAQSDQSFRVGYLARVNKNGDAIFLTPDGRLSATIDAKGLVKAPTDRRAAVDCYGKTLDQLRADGRVMEFQRTK